MAGEGRVWAWQSHGARDWGISGGKEKQARHVKRTTRCGKRLQAGRGEKVFIMIYVARRSFLRAIERRWENPASGSAVTPNHKNFSAAQISVSAPGERMRLSEAGDVRKTVRMFRIRARGAAGNMPLSANYVRQFGP